MYDHTRFSLFLFSRKAERKKLNPFHHPYVWGGWRNPPHCAIVHWQPGDSPTVRIHRLALQSLATTADWVAFDRVVEQKSVSRSTSVQLVTTHGSKFCQSQLNFNPSIATLRYMCPKIKGILEIQHSRFINLFLRETVWLPPNINIRVSHTVVRWRDTKI